MMERLNYTHTRKLEKQVRGLALAWIFAQLNIWRYAVALIVIMFTMLCGCGVMTWTLLFR